MAWRILGMVGALLAMPPGLGCSGTPPSANPPEPGPVAPTATVPAAGTATAAETTPVASPEPAGSAGPTEQPQEAPDAAAMLAELGSEGTADLPFLRRLCRTVVGKYTDALIPELNEAKPQLGCACCPPFDECPPEASAAVEVVHPRLVYTMRHRSAGSFTARGARQIAATFWGCEPGAANRGGTVVLRDVGQRFELVEYRTGVNPDGCQTFSTRGGRDLLLCEWGDGQGGHWLTRVIAYDLADDSFKSDRTIAELVFEHPCFLNVGMDYVRTKLTKMSQRDLDGDGHNDVVLHVEHVAGTVTPKLLAECTPSPDDFPEAKSFPPPWKTQLHYLFDGRAFAPAPKTLQRLRRMATSTVFHGQP
jgi:hypothetical protein